MPNAMEKEPLVNKECLDVQEQKGGVRDIKCRHYVLFPVITCYFVAAGLHYYVTTEWIQYYVKTEVFRNVSMTTAQDGCKTPNHSDPAYQMYQQVQETTASWNMYRTLPSSLCSLIVVTVLPSYSDSVGRRFLFISGFIGTTLCIALSAVAIYFKLNLWILVGASVIDNLTGSFLAVSSAACAYVSDLTKSGRSRTIAITANDTAQVLCITVTGLATGFIVQIEGYFFAEAAGVVVIVVGFVLMLLFLPETHVKHERSNVHNVLDNFKRTFAFYGNSQFHHKRSAYLLLIGAFVFAEITTERRSVVEILYQLGMPFCWTNEMVGIFSSTRHAAQSIVGVMLVPLLKMCVSDVTVAILSTLFNGASFVIEGIATTELMMYLVPVVLGFLCIPMIKSVMSIITPSDKQGSLFASIVTVTALSNLLNGFLLNFVYRSTVTFYNGFVFLMLAGICGLSCLLLIIFSLTQTVEPATRETRIKKHEIRDDALTNV